MAEATLLSDAVTYTAPDGTVHTGRCIGTRDSGSIMEVEDGCRPENCEIADALEQIGVVLANQRS